METQIVQVGNLKHRRSLSGHVMWVNAVVFSPDSATLASGAEEGEIRLWRVSDGVLLHTIKAHKKRVWSLDFTPNSELLASASFEEVRIWRIDNGSLFRTHQIPGLRQGPFIGSVLSVDFSPDGKVLAAGGSDGKIYMWSVVEGVLLKSIEAHGLQAVHCVTYGSVSPVLASASADKTVKLWRIPSGECIRVLESHWGRVWTVAFSPDDQIIASGAEDKKIRLLLNTR